MQQTQITYSDYKKQIGVEKLFFIKTSACYNTKDGQPTNIKRVYASLKDGAKAEPLIWCATTAAELLAENFDKFSANDLAVTTVEKDGKKFMCITAMKRQTLGAK